MNKTAPVRELEKAVSSLDMSRVSLKALRGVIPLIEAAASAEGYRRANKFEKTLWGTLRVGDVVKLRSTVSVCIIRGYKYAHTKELRVTHLYRWGCLEGQIAEGQYKGYGDRPYIHPYDIKRIFRRGKLVLDVCRLRRSLEV